MATAITAWPDKIFNEHTNSSVCMFQYFNLFLIHPLKHNINHQNLHGVRMETLIANYLLLCLELNPAQFSCGKDDVLYRQRG